MTIAKTRSKKTFVGPRLRELRKERGETQAAMAQALGISATYINLLENNQRSLSLQVLMRFSDVYGVDWRDLVESDAPNLLADLRNAMQDQFSAMKKSTCRNSAPRSTTAQSSRAICCTCTRPIASSANGY